MVKLIGDGAERDEDGAGYMDRGVLVAFPDVVDGRAVGEVALELVDVDLGKVHLVS